MTRFLPALALVTVGFPAFAEPATPQEADRLQTVFERYLGTIDGVVKVTPSDEFYDLTLDVSPLIAMIPPDAGVEAEVSSVTFALTPQGRGRWLVENAEPFSLDVAIAGELEMSFSSGTTAFSGIWSEALMAFESSSSTVTDLSMTQWQNDLNMGATTTKYVFDRMETQSTARPNESGGVDFDYQANATGIFESIVTENPEFPFAIDITIDSYSVDYRGRGMRSAQLLDLVAWFVARPSPEAIMADEEGLKAALSAALPVFETIEVTSRAEKLDAPTPFGRFAADALDMTVEMNGAVHDGWLRQKFALEGMQLPLDMVPDWAHPLMPESVTLDFNVADYDLAGPAEAFLNEVDFATGPLPGFEDKLLSLLLPDGTLSVGMVTSGATSAIYDLSMDGGMKISMTGLPTGKGSISLRGMLAISEAVGEAPEDITSGALPALALLRGMARPEGETLIWDIEGTKDGQILVNGVDISSMIPQ